MAVEILTTQVSVTGVLGNLTLGDIEVSRNSDDSACNRYDSVVSFI
jgi:hypothetical protein